jgi:tetratricopeptide (TPR) repeat protein
MRKAYYKNINQSHIDISLAYELLGKLHFSIGQPNEAEKYHNIAFENKMKVLGEYNFETIDSINERGRIMLSKKKDEEAKKYFSKLGVVSMDLLGPCNQYEALSFNNLGCVYYN